MSSPSPVRVAVAKPAPGAAKPAVAKPAVAKAVAKPPLSLTLSTELPSSPPGRTRADTFPAPAPSPTLASESSSKGVGVGLAKPVAPVAKPAQNFAKSSPKPAPPTATLEGGAALSPAMGALKKSPAVTASSPKWSQMNAAPTKKNVASIATLRNKWEHTTTTANSLSDAKINMCEKKNLSSLLKLHRCNNVRVQSLTQEVLDNIEELPTGELSMMIKNGFRPLVDLTKFNEEDIQVWALWALANLASHTPCQVAIIMEVGWHNIKTRYAASNLAEMKQATCLLLANLAHSEKNQQGIIEKGVPILMTFLRFHDSEMLIWALRALAEVTVIKDYGAKEIWDNELLGLIIPYVMSEDQPDVQLCAIQILSNICADDTTKTFEKVLAEGVVDVLVNSLQSENADMAANAAAALAYLAKRETGAIEIKKSGGHTNLITLLDSNNQFVQLGVSTAINHMTDFAEIAALIKAEDAVEPLKELIFSTPSQAVEKQALQALKKLDHEALLYVEKKLSEEPKQRNILTQSGNVARDKKAMEEAKRREEQMRRDSEEEKKREREKEEERRRSADLEQYLAQKTKDEAADKKRKEDEEKRREEDKRKQEEQKREEERKRDDEKREKDAKLAEAKEREREEEERKRMLARLGKEEQIERNRLEQMRIQDEERRKLDHERRQIAEDKMRLELLQTQREEEDRIRAQKERVERELEDKKKEMVSAQLEDEKRKADERLRDELQKLERMKKELELERKHLSESRLKESAEEKRLMDERINLEKELLEKSRKALDEEKKLLEKLQRDKEEEEKLRAERLKVEHSIEMQKLAADKNRLAQERQQMEADLQAEKARMDRQKDEMLQDIERRKKEERERLEREKEYSELVKNSSGNLFADEIKAMEERMKAEREVLETERKNLYKLKEDKFELEREKANLERARKQYEEERKLKEEEDAARRAQELKEIAEMKRKIAEDQERAAEEREKFQATERDWEKRLEEEKLKIESENKKLQEDSLVQNKSAEEQERIETERQRLEEEREKLGKEREAFQEMRRRNTDAEETGEESRRRDLEELIRKEEEARKHAEEERKRLEEVQKTIEEERRKAEEHKEAIHSLLEGSDDADVDTLRLEATKLRRELADMQQERDELAKERELLGDMEKDFEGNTERRMQEERTVIEKENEMLTAQLIAKETELAMREKKLRDAEADVMRIMMKMDRSYDDEDGSEYSRDERGRGRGREREVGSSRSRSRSSRSRSGSMSRSDTEYTGSIISRGRNRNVRRSITPNGLRRVRSRSQDSRSRSLSTGSSYTETLTRTRDSSNDRYTESYISDSEMTRTEFSDDESYAGGRKRGGAKDKRRSRRRSIESDYTRTEMSDDEREREINKRQQQGQRESYRSPRNYVDTPDLFDGGGKPENEDDLESVASMDGLIESDPHLAAKELTQLLENDDSKKLNEGFLESLIEFGKVRGGEPTQLEAREIIPVLLHILNLYVDKTHLAIVNLTLLILAILAYNKDINQLYIRRGGGGQTLIDLLDFQDNTVKARAALALASYSLNNALIKKECAPAIKKLLAMLSENSADEPLKMSVCAALASLSDGYKENQKRICKKKNGLKLILQLIASNQIPPKYALNLIAALAHKNTKVQTQVRTDYEGIFRKIVRLLSPYTKPRILKAAINVLVELVRNNDPNKKHLVKAGAVPFLVNILLSKNNQNPEIVGGALYLCWASYKHHPNRFESSEFRNQLGGLAEAIQPLRSLESEYVQKVIAQIDVKLNKRNKAGTPQSPSLAASR